MKIFMRIKLLFAGSLLALLYCAIFLNNHGAQITLLIIFGLIAFIAAISFCFTGHPSDWVEIKKPKNEKQTQSYLGD